MKDRLEEFVMENRLDFDSLEPSEALWEGIEKKMDKGRSRSLGYYISRVAAIAAIFVLSLMVQKYFMHSKNVYKQIPELAEAENYYSGLINAKLEQAKPMLVEFPDIQSEIKADMSELDEIYESLKEDLQDNVANQEVIEAMVENYRLRIKILEEMMCFLEKQNEDKNIENNSSEYDVY